MCLKHSILTCTNCDKSNFNMHRLCQSFIILTMLMHFIGGQDIIHKINSLTSKSQSHRILKRELYQKYINNNITQTSYDIELRSNKNTVKNSSIHSYVPKNKTFLRRFMKLQNISRGAEKIVLPFTFPFYSSEVSTVYVTTEGFLSMGNSLHRDMHHYAYAAPLLSNLVPDPDDGEIVMHETPNYVTFEWNNVLLEKDHQVGKFSFECTLHRNGCISFYYKKIPTNDSSDETLASIFNNNASVLHGLSKEDSIHPNITIGLSDAALQIDRATNRKKVISQNKLSIKLSEISSGSLVTFTPVLKCEDRNKCFTCLDESMIGKCVWCFGSKKCFDSEDLTISGLRFDQNKCILQTNETQKYCQFERRTPPKYKLGEKETMTPFYRLHWIDHESLKRTNMHFWDIFSKSVVQIPIYKMDNEPFSFRLPFLFPFFDNTLLNVHVGKNGIILLSPTTENGDIYDTPHEKYKDKSKKFSIVPIALDLRPTSDSRLYYSMKKESVWIQYNNFPLPFSSNITCTFRITMLANGAISFAYDNLPISLSTSKKYKIGIFAKDDENSSEVNLAPYAKYIHGKTEIVFVYKITCSLLRDCISCEKIGSKCCWDSESETCDSISLSVSDKMSMSNFCGRICLNGKENYVEKISEVVTVGDYLYTDRFKFESDDLENVEYPSIITSIVIILISILILFVTCGTMAGFAKTHPNSNLGRLSLHITRKYTLLISTNNTISSERDTQLTTFASNDNI